MRAIRFINAKAKWIALGIVALIVVLSMVLMVVRPAMANDSKIAGKIYLSSDSLTIPLSVNSTDFENIRLTRNFNPQTVILPRIAENGARQTHCENIAACYPIIHLEQLFVMD
jgi:hypothetical protein